MGQKQLSLVVTPDKAVLVLHDPEMGSSVSRDMAPKGS